MGQERNDFQEEESLEMVSKFWIAFKGTAQADEKAKHIQSYVSNLKKPETTPLGVRLDFETIYKQFIEMTA